MSDTSPPMPSLVGTWQAQWRAAGRTVLKNEVNNLSEHLGPCPSFISAPLLPLLFISPPSLFSLHPHIRQEELFFFSFGSVWALFYFSLTVSSLTLLHSLYLHRWILVQALIIIYIFVFEKCVKLLCSVKGDTGRDETTNQIITQLCTFSFSLMSFCCLTVSVHLSH